MRFLVLSFLLFGCVPNLCMDSDAEIDYDICLFYNGHNIDDKIVEKIVRETKKEIIDWDYQYTEVNTDQALYGNQISISFKKDVFVDGKRAGGLCRYYPDMWNSYEIEIAAREFSTTMISAIIHEFLHVFMLDIESEASHRAGWFHYEFNSYESNERSLQKKIFEKLKSEQLYLE